MTTQRTISPVDGSVYVERELAGPAQIEDALEGAVRAFQGWRKVPVGERAAILTRFCAALPYFATNHLHRRAHANHVLREAL